MQHVYFIINYLVSWMLDVFVCSCRLLDEEVTDSGLPENDCQFDVCRACIYVI